LRRIAVALDVRMEDLLGSGAEPETTMSPAGRQPLARPNGAAFAWTPIEEGPVRPRVAASFTSVAPAVLEDSRTATEAFAKPRSLGTETPFAREGELMSKLHDLLHSPLGECITSVVDDLHRILAQVRSTG
jgi:hypothetical protein